MKVAGKTIGPSRSEWVEELQLVAQAMTIPEGWINARDISRELGGIISTRHIQNLLDDGKVPRKMIRRTNYYEPKAVMAVLRLWSQRGR